MKYINAADYSIEIGSCGGEDVSDKLAAIEREFQDDEGVLSVSVTEDGARSDMEVRVKLKQGTARPDRLVEKVLAGSEAYVKTIRKLLYRENRGILESPFGIPVKEEHDL